MIEAHDDRFERSQRDEHEYWRTTVTKKIKVRLAEVAREAGVSVATVDRVIHGRPGVKRHTSDHILTVIGRLENRGGDETGDRQARRPARHERDFLLKPPHRTP